MGKLAQFNPFTCLLPFLLEQMSWTFMFHQGFQASMHITIPILCVVILPVFSIAQTKVHKDKRCSRLYRPLRQIWEMLI